MTPIKTTIAVQINGFGRSHRRVRSVAGCGTDDCAE